MSPEKNVHKVLIVSKSAEHEVSRELTDLTLTFKTKVEPSLPEDFNQQYDGIVLHDIPENIAELADNYEIPVLATGRAADAIRRQGYDRFVGLAPSVPVQVEMLTRLFEKKDDVQVEWKRLQSTLRLKYNDILHSIEDIVQSQQIPFYEAFFQFIDRNTKDAEEIMRTLDVPVTRAYAELLMYADAYGRFFETPNAAHFRDTARKHLSEYLDHVAKRREHLKNVFHLTGPSVGGGSHYLYNDPRSVKHDASEFSFLKEVRTKDGIPHAVIANIIYHDAKQFNQPEYKDILRIPDSKPPLESDGKSYLVRQGVIGPDMEDLLLSVRRSIASADSRVKYWLRQFRDNCVYSMLRNINQWQNNALAITAPEVSDAPEDIAQHLRKNLNDAFTTYARIAPVSDIERKLWETSSRIFNPADLDLTENTLTRHFDSSLSNVKFFTGSMKVPDTDDLEELIEAKRWKSLDSPAKERIADRLHYVDHGYTFAHEDEDFFHVATSFALHEKGLSAAAKLQKIGSYYSRLNSYRGRGRMKPNKLTYWLHGYYRNLVSGHLNLRRYEREQKAPRLVRDRHIHRLGLAEAFAADSINYLTSAPGISEEQMRFSDTAAKDAAYIAEKAAQYEQALGQQPQPTDAANHAYLNNARMHGLRYFAEKFEKIKPQAQNPPASRPASP
jgi:hypothetical protein